MKILFVRIPSVVDVWEVGRGMELRALFVHTTSVFHVW